MADLEKSGQLCAACLCLFVQHGVLNGYAYLLANGGKQPVKILGDGSLTKKLTVQAHKFSNSAQTSIEKAGGSCEVVAL